MSLKQRREHTELRLARKRKRQTPEEQGVLGPEGKLAKFHDILVIGPPSAIEDDEIVRVPVVKVTSIDNQGHEEKEGSYVDSPEKLDAYDYSHRRTLSMARPDSWGTNSQMGSPRGPAFGTLPVKREPAATACIACYLVDAQNFTHTNAWTAEEWNDMAGEDLAPATSVDDPSFEALLAGPRGMVFHVKVVLEADARSVDWRPGESVQFANSGGSIECVDLRHEMEIWNQLRNGTVAGRVSYRKAAQNGRPESVPLVNITSLIPDEELA